MTEILVEKYRPKDIKDVIGLDGKFNIKIDQNLPHLLLCGIQGSGKTTLAKIIIKELGAEALILNSSKDRGIDMVRNQVNSFAACQSMNGGIRIVFLDEADGITNEGQTSLRNAMETYAANCRFILTCNYPNKIIDPIKSRCVVVEFNGIKSEDVVARLEYICKEEGIPYERDALVKIVSMTGSDVRSAINKLEEMRDGVTVAKIKTVAPLAREIYDLLKFGAFEDARTKYLDAKPDDEQFLKDFYDAIMMSADSEAVKFAAIRAIAKCYPELGKVAWKQILIEDMMLTVMEKCA